MMKQSFTLGPLAICLIAVFQVGIYADCYSIDGRFALDNPNFTGIELVSCGEGTHNCCLRSQKCGSNLLCKDENNNQVSRQYCDNKDWIGCSKICAGSTSSGITLVDCRNNTFCCGKVGDCCANGNPMFVNPDTGELKPISQGKGVTKEPKWWSVDSSSLLASASTSPPTSRASSMNTASSTSNHSSSPIADNSSSGLSIGASAGIGIGSGVAALAVAGLGWFFWRRKKSTSRLGPYEVDTNNLTSYENTTQRKIAYKFNDDTELEGESNQPHEGERNQPHEIRTPSRHEIDGTSRHELGT
ncbi:hypothetical protein BS50DRAFT_626005 [Corynespora cassiicola Philippines]|uniref:Mid2 domain-containing protein n=1 Tax=Corynespora cassiicola Philippines TaxID=1448308 RepID=A0A2T2N5Z4_CORCC|nr:hypothetical protein BS50DRAFT_626005 [Corynespora cassiicola Philippines]